ncbi:BMC domain-containing protein [Variovorax sp. LT1P1]|uniref:BMC domain-containing protein n=1 Tax=Variovorax sp. LT1P1 TaxID=3443730 RepID=UPI003F4562EE
MSTLRSYIFLDRLQPQLMCLLGSTARGYLPRHNDAALVIEVAPGMDIEWLTDVALKHDDVKPGSLVVERQFGYLEFHSKYAASVKSAGAAVLEAMGVSPASTVKPEILASKIVDRVDGYHAFLVNRSKAGNMLLPGESLFIMEMTSSSYALLAANEAEKSANIKLVDCRFIGAAGRLYLAGSADDVRTAAQVAEATLRGFVGGTL